jgi:hypothetical protein
MMQRSTWRGNAMHGWVALRLAVLFLAVGACTGLAGRLSAQPTYPTGAGLGYVVRAPDQLLGFSAHAISGRRGGVGLYLDAKFDLDSPARTDLFLADRSAAQADAAGHRRFREQFSWTTANAALIRPLGPALAAYAGAGLSRRRVYSEWSDPTGSTGIGGVYIVEDPDFRATQANFLGGFIFVIGRVSLHFGGESTPRGATVGGMYTVPIQW